MKIELDKSLELPLNPARAWDFLQDIESVAACLPGARITERVDESHYRGAVTVRLGPATVTFNGLIEVAARDVAARRMRILGTGSDAGGSSAATLDLIASIEDRDGSHSTLTGHSEVSVSGKIALIRRPVDAKRLGCADQAVLRKCAGESQFGANIRIVPVGGRRGK